MTTEVTRAVVIAAAVLVSGVLLRFLGRWFARALHRDFTRLVRDANHERMDGLAQSIDLMRSEQTEQHGQVRAEVARLVLQMEVVDTRLDRIESRIYPPAPTKED